MKAARDAGLKVMLDGQGGDEVLAGYPRITWAYRFADLAAHGRLTTLASEARASGLSAGGLAEAFFTPLVPEGLRASVRSRRGDSNRLVHERLRSLSAPVPRRAGGPFRDRLRTHYHGVLSQFVLPELLRYEDRNTMAHSLEGRVPFLDHRFVELMYGLPAEALIRDGAVKVALRDALSDLLPAPVRDRRDKVAFLTPETRFLQGALGSFAHDVFSAPATRSHAFVNQDEAVRRVAAVRSGRPVGLGLWRALSVELWARAYLD
jgi:asparagine synthase (glutamine-hydrolysing)